MNLRQAIESEIRATAGEMVGSLRMISEGVGPLRRATMRRLVLEVEHQLAKLAWLADQLP
jgi:hypothetical protein